QDLTAPMLRATSLRGGRALVDGRFSAATGLASADAASAAQCGWRADQVRSRCNLLQLIRHRATIAQTWWPAQTGCRRCNEADDRVESAGGWTGAKFSGSLRDEKRTSKGTIAMSRLTTAACILLSVSLVLPTVVRGVSAVIGVNLPLAN